jgi:hypothetical protein
MNNLPPLDRDEFFETAGKLMDGGLSREQADVEAIRRLAGHAPGKEDRGEGQKSTAPRFEKIGDIEIKPIDWIIKGFLTSGDLAMVYGDSGTYKSFFTIALAGAVACGVDFFGISLRKPGSVFYIASEGQGGIVRRFKGWAQNNRYDLKDRPIYRYSASANLIEATGVLYAAIEEALKTEAAPPVLAVIDTLAASLGGDDSDTGDSSLGLAALGKLRGKFPGMAFVLVHHTGHNEKTRARGAYLWRAAMDVEYRLEKADPKNPESRAVNLINTKAKETDLLPPMSFQLKPRVVYGPDGEPLRNEDGEVETTGVLERIPYTPPEQQPRGENQAAIVRILGENKEGMEKGKLEEAFSLRTGKRKSQLDQALGPLVERGIVRAEGARFVL